MAMLHQPINTDDAAKLANAYLRSGQLKEAETIFRQVLAVNRNHFDALHGLGLVAMNLGMFSNAAELIRSALQQNPFDYTAHNNLGIALMQQGNLDEAVQSFNKSLSIKQDYANALYNLARAHQELGNHGLGLEMMLKARGYVRFTLSQVQLLSTTSGEQSKDDIPPKAA